jgi:DNA-directed RNA polymerase specialized sigma24 family protein
MDKLFLWVYCEANHYYRLKSWEHTRLTLQDAEDLAAQFILEFESVWKDVRSVARYTRTVLKRNLYRHLAEISGRPATVSLDHLENGVHAVSQTHAPWMTFSDRTYEVYHALCKEYFQLPVKTKILVNARLRHPPTPYGTICEALGLDESTARVYASRFLQRVRRRYERNIRRH